MPRPVDKNMPADAIPASDTGITGATRGSLGGASTADLRRGFTDAGSEPSGLHDGLIGATPQPQGGFLSRPHGWER